MNDFVKAICSSEAITTVCHFLAQSMIYLNQQVQGNQPHCSMAV